MDLADASPEARVAVAAYGAVHDDLGRQLPATVSGRELVTAGFGRDVDIAASLDVARVVPRLYGESFVGEMTPGD
jgi:2-phosphosulfolactate phosphatase